MFRFDKQQGFFASPFSLPRMCRPYGADGLFAGFLYKLSAPTALLVLSHKVEEASLPLFTKTKSLEGS